MRTIGSHAFYCTDLSELILPQSLTEVGEYAFVCDGPTSLTLPPNLKKMDVCAFLCKNIETLYDNRYENAGGFPGCFPQLKTIVIGNNATKISLKYLGDVMHPENIQSIIIPNSVKEIGKSAFFGCSGLRELKIPNSVTSIGQYAFCRCSALTSFVIPDSVDEILSGTFSDCKSMETITIGKFVKSIKTDLCLPKMKNIYSLAQEPPVLDESVFSISAFYSVITLHVPTGCKAAYQAADYWKEFFNIVEEDLSGIKTPVVSQQETDAPYYDLEGREVLQPEKGRIYIHGGRKVLVK